MKRFSYGKQFIDQEDIDTVLESLKSDWLTQGPKVKEFEQSLADYCGARFAVAVNSGTSALHIAYQAIDLGKDDELITTPITFLATANAAVYCGAKPVLADIDYNSVNIDPEKVWQKISSKTKAVVPVHFAGLPCDMQKISDLAQKNNLIVIEDACHALGSSYKVENEWIKVGSCKHSKMAVFSFHPVKNITTGEGGAITTNDESLYKNLCALRSHGMYKDEATAKKGKWYYEMRDLGYNYRITDLQCALGLSQLKKLDEFINKRREIASWYDELFVELGDLVKLPITTTERFQSACHLYVLRLNTDKLISNRKEIFNELHERGIGVQIHYIPINHQPFYKKFHYEPNMFENAEKYYSQCLSLPIYYKLEKADIEYIFNQIKEVINNYK
ncbi:UDP-4-amino-4,6-dideoxy-N-acetyl-beta-L-altrosamine transaminase [Candidatus Kuenenbacteria bacterium]|nr:UDP-4-amino-4,6-dideoxy-N-acetyl-beta-L-altrosamine transaminase [Candidatus Kuenenbacteria bacterium]